MVRVRSISNGNGVLILFAMGTGRECLATRCLAVEEASLELPSAVRIKVLQWK